MTCNIRSLAKNFDDFIVVLDRLDIEFDVMVLSECWLHEGSQVGQIPGYNFFRTDKYINKSGGVVVYVRNRWTTSAAEPQFEDANCLEISIGNSITILGIYRSPSFTKTDRFLQSLDNKLQSIKDRACIVVAGDINIDLIMGDSDAQCNEYLCLMASHGLLPSITKPTRGDACLDHIFVKLEGSAEGIVCDSALTDHDIAIAGLQTSKPKTLYKKR